MSLYFLYSFGDWGLLVLRLVIASIFLYHCRSKFSMPSGFMRFIGTAELAGGIAMVLGILVQWAALGLAIIMLGAIYKKITVWHVPFSAQDKSGWELDLMILAGTIALLTLGGGMLAL